MPSLKEIKTRIASVQSTRKITSAMKMVASSKLHRAQTAIQNMLPYENLLEHILKSFLVSMPDAAEETSRKNARTSKAWLSLFIPRIAHYAEDTTITSFERCNMQ